MRHNDALLKTHIHFGLYTGDDNSKSTTSTRCSPWRTTKMIDNSGKTEATCNDPSAENHPTKPTISQYPAPESMRQLFPVMERDPSEAR